MENKKLVLVINPGSTSTKIAVFDGLTEVFSDNVTHDSAELAKYKDIFDQYEFRYKEVVNKLDSNGISLKDLSVVVGRGGLLHPLESGTYKVNDAMLEDLKQAKFGQHASNLGAAIAKQIASVAGVNAYITDPVVVDEMDEVAKITGVPEIRRMSRFHALNHKSCARRAAKELGKRYDEINLVIVHLGGGVSVGAHKKGKVVDVNNALLGDGPFSTERTGTMPTGDVLSLVFDKGMTLGDIKKRFAGGGGLVAHCGTNNALEIEKRIAEGDQKAELAYRAMAYQVGKEVGAMAAVLEGNVDAIILTGGLARSKMLVEWMSKMISFVGKILVYPGENELVAMAEAGIRVLNGEETVKEYV